MKRLILILSLFLLATPAWGSLLSFDSTGEYAQKYDFGFYLGGSNFGWVGGPVANNSLGNAFQFEVGSPILIGNIVSDISVWDYYRPDECLGLDHLYFDYIFYSGTERDRYYNKLIPDMSTELARTHIDLYNDTDRDLTYLDHYSQPIDLWLDSGTYWLAYERGFSDSMSTGQISNVRYKNMILPEPTTMILFAFGFASALLKKRLI